MTFDVNLHLEVCTTVEKEQCEEKQERKLETKCTTVDAEKCQQVIIFTQSVSS